MFFDSNLLIYASKPAQRGLRDFLFEHLRAVSDITRLEVLGYHALGPLERRSLEQFLDYAAIYEVRPYLIDAAIELRQQKSMSVGDAIIAATALHSGLTLATHNTKDFAWIEGLDVVDPLAT